LPGSQIHWVGLPVTEFYHKMSDQRVPIWAADADLDDDVELNLLNLVIGNYGQNNFEDGALDQ